MPNSKPPGIETATRYRTFTELLIDGTRRSTSSLRAIVWTNACPKTYNLADFAPKPVVARFTFTMFPPESDRKPQPAIGPFPLVASYPEHGNLK